jgi:linoleoyl-CoA desaturase
MWKIKHKIIHHTYTNLDELDDDVNAKPFLRLHEDQPYEPKHRNQYKWWYWGFFYCLLYPLWVWYTDYKKYFTKKISFKPIKLKLIEHFVFWASKLVYIFISIYQVGFWWWLLGYSVVSLICSFRISIIFQLAHIVIDVAHPSKDADRRDEYFIHQASTTANFAVNNRWISWWVGGLNFQLEHHLFPEVSHVHYPALHKHLMPTYLKWQVPIVVYRRFKDAKRAHTAYLKKLSIKPL